MTVSGGGTGFGRVSAALCTGVRKDWSSGPRCPPPSRGRDPAPSGDRPRPCDKPPVRRAWRATCSEEKRKAEDRGRCGSEADALLLLGKGFQNCLTRGERPFSPKPLVTWGLGPGDARPRVCPAPQGTAGSRRGRPHEGVRRVVPNTTKAPCSEQVSDGLLGASGPRSSRTCPLIC